MNQLITGEKPIWTRVAFSLFLLFVFFLPLYEAPKNIFSSLFVLLGAWSAITNRHKHRCSKQHHWFLWVFGLFALSAVFAGFDAPASDYISRFDSALNWALIPACGAVFIYYRPTEHQLRWFLRIVLLGSVIAILHGFYTRAGPYPELNSVGHVNQSSLYLVFVLLVVGQLFFKRKHDFDTTLCAVTMILCFTYLIPARSLVAAGCSAFAILGLLIIYWFVEPMTVRKIAVVAFLGLISITSACGLPFLSV